MSGSQLVHGQDLEAPWSPGAAPPLTPAPLGATDCHHHIFDARYSREGQPKPADATVEDYALFKRRLGLSRSVVVAPSNYGTDNSCLVDALEKMGSEIARGVALVDPGVSDAELDDLHAVGVRGMRVYLAKNRVPSRDELIAMGRRAADRGWTLQFVGNREREVLVEWEAILLDLPCPIVVDHFGWAPQPAGVASRTADLLRRLMTERDAYVKLSGLYLSSRTGPPLYHDLDELAAQLVGAAPEHVIWGSDWPHPMAGNVKPDGAMLFDRLALWAPDEAIRRIILVDNPTRLYWAS